MVPPRRRAPAARPSRPRATFRDVSFAHNGDDEFGSARLAHHNERIYLYSLNAPATPRRIGRRSVPQGPPGSPVECGCDRRISLIWLVHTAARSSAAFHPRYRARSRPSLGPAKGEEICPARVQSAAQPFLRGLVTTREARSPAVTKTASLPLLSAACVPRSLEVPTG